MKEYKSKTRRPPGKTAARKRSARVTQPTLRPFGDILEEISDAFVALDPNWRIAYVNEQAARIFGRTREDLIGKHIWTEFPGRIGRPFNQACSQAVESQRTTCLEEYYPQYDRWYENRIYPSKDGLAIFSTDITERKQAESVKRESERVYQMLTQVSPVGIFRTDALGHTTFVNPRWCELSNLDSARALGEGWLAAVHPQDREGLAAGWTQAAQSQSISTAEYRFIHPDGTIVWVVGQAVPEKDGQGNVVGYIGTVTDITDRKHMEEDLRKKNRALKTLSACNQALVRVSDEPELLDEICRVCTEIGGYRMAWVGYAEQDEKRTVRPVAQSGFEQGYLDPADITWADEELGRGPAGTALRTLQPSIARNILDDPAYAPWRAAAAQRGFASAIALPLTNRDQVLGALNIYASEANAFDDEQVKLLAELASDLAYGVATLRARAEHARAEQALRENEQRLASIYNTVGDVIFQLSVEPGEQYRFSSVNPAFSKVTGLPSQAVVGRRVSDVIPQPSLGIVLDKYRQAIEEKTIACWEETSDYPTGRLIGEVSVAAVFDKAGACTDLVGSVHDVTERKRAEEKIRRDADEFAALYEIARDLAAQRDLPVLLQRIVNHAARLTGASDAITYLYDPAREELELVAALIEMRPIGSRFKAGEGASGQVVQTRRPIIVDDYHTWEHHRPELEGVDLNAVAQVPMIYAGDIIGVLGIAEIGKERKFTSADVNLLELLAAQAAIAIHNARLMDEIQRANVELEHRVNERTAELQTANKELESFSYSVSHDLRAPLRAISGFSEIIARRHRANLNEEGQHYVDNIVQASERMGHLIDDLLQYSRLGRTGVRRDPVRLQDVLGPLASDLAVRLNQIGGTLTMAKDPPIVLGDRTLLAQVFSNLLENALTYRKRDVPAQVAVDWKIEGSEVVVCVRDNGIGIPPEHHEKIFNVFQRLHSEDEYPGTGIGLATVKKSVDLLRGKVWVESQPGAGSAFFVQLPKG